MGEGRYASSSEIAAPEKIERGFFGALLYPTPLARDLVEAILDGRQSEGVTLPKMMEPFPVEWRQQAREWVSQARRRRD